MGTLESLSSMPKFGRSHPRQHAISDAVVKMVIKDLVPLRIVECEGFRALLALIEPRYRMVSRQHIQLKLLPRCRSKVEETIIASLQGVESCSTTLDIWTSRRMHAYLGITCHFLTSDWQMKSVLLSCSHLVGRHTSVNILSEFDEVADKYGITERIYRAVTDNASNMKKAFPETVSLPGFEVEDDDDDLIDVSDLPDEEEVSSDLLDLSLGPQRVSCFAHTLALCVKDGLASVRGPLSSVLGKAARVVNHVKKSVSATEKIEKMFGKTLVSKNDTRWNSQLKMIRRLTEVNVDEVVEKRELRFTSYEKALMKELVEVLESFEEATDIVQGEKYVSVSLAIPCVIGLQKHLSRFVSSSRNLGTLAKELDKSLNTRMGSISTDLLYMASAFLDPRFKLTWCDEDKADEVKRAVLDAVVSLSPNGDEHASSSETEAVQSSEIQPPLPKKSKLFAFLADKQVPKKKKTCTEEMEAYIRDESNENPLEYWRNKCNDFPALARLARRVLGVPATSAPIERVFSQAGKILRPDRSRLLPTNLETLLFLKVNSHLM